jgi:hypothetical protein
MHHKAIKSTIVRYNPDKLVLRWFLFRFQLMKSGFQAPDTSNKYNIAVRLLFIVMT